MKKPTCLVLTIIGVLLLIIGLVVVVPWFVDLFQEFGKMGERHEEHMISIRQYVNTPLNAEQEQLLSQLLVEQDVKTDPQKPGELESILSTEPYITYLSMQDGADYSDYNSFINMMPTQNHRSVVMSRLNKFFETEIEEAAQKIWLDFYYTIREWGKDGKTQSNAGKEFNDLLQKHLVKPLMEDSSNTDGFSSKIIKMGIISSLIVEENSVFHRVWYHRIKSHGLQEGYLRSAIVSPAEFALMRSFFDNADEFINWLSEPFGIDQKNEEPANQ